VGVGMGIFAIVAFVLDLLEQRAFGVVGVAAPEQTRVVADGDELGN
jgi:hypothetical protein